MGKLKNDTIIKELMAKVEEQKVALGTKPRSILTTNGLFKKDANNFFNLNTVSDPEILAKALGFLIGEEKNFKAACSSLGIFSLEYKWDGYTVEEWRSDFLHRVLNIEYDKKKKQLDETKRKLSTLVSEEARTAMELDDIKKTLGM